MIPPDEIRMKNRDGALFRATASFRMVGTEKEWLYKPSADAFQYRVVIPGMAISMIIQDVTRRELREYLRTNKPVLIKPAI
jgi:hypothetical protein